MQQGEYSIAVTNRHFTRFFIFLLLLKLPLYNFLIGHDLAYLFRQIAAGRVQWSGSSNQPTWRGGR